MPRAVVLASLAAAAEAFVASGPTVAALRMRPRVRLDGAGADSGTGALSLRAVGQRPSSAMLTTTAVREEGSQAAVLIGKRPSGALQSTTAGEEHSEAGVVTEAKGLGEITAVEHKTELKLAEHQSSGQHDPNTTSEVATVAHGPELEDAPFNADMEELNSVRIALETAFSPAAAPPAPTARTTEPAQV